MKLIKKLLLFSVISLFILSCNDKTEHYYNVDYNIEQTYKSNPDTVILKINLETNINDLNNLVIEIPNYLSFNILINEKSIIKNSNNIIFNSSNNDSISVSSVFENKQYFIQKKDLISNNLIIEITNNYKPQEYKDIIKIYAKQSKTNQEEIIIPKNQTPEYFSNSTLPIIKINTNKQPITDTNKTIANYELTNLKDKDSGIFKIKVRGSSSKLFPKKSYAITAYNDSLVKKKTKLLGLPKETEWILYAPFLDNSFMRNVLTYDLHRKMGNYSPRTKFCHLIINNDYRGIYVLTEKIKRGKNRVNIKKLKPNNKDITGGYIVKLDKGKGRAWRSPYKSQVDSGFDKWFIYVYPKKKNLTENQAKYIQDYMCDFEKAIVEKTDWKKYIDLKSFIDYQIMMELTKNVDAYRLSLYFSKDTKNKLKIEPLWDSNLSFGLSSYLDGYKTDGLMYNFEATPFWWKHFLEDNEYKQMFKKRWVELRLTTLSEKEILKSIDKNYYFLKDEIKFNNIKWDTFNQKNNWRKYNHSSFGKSVEYIKTWTKKRLNYLDSVFSEL